MASPVEQTLRDLALLEQQTGGAVTGLLEQARRQLMRRLADLPADFAEVEVITAMRVAVDRAMEEVRTGMAASMTAAVGQAADIGVQYAVATLPTAEERIAFALNPFVVNTAARYSATLITGLTDEVRAEITRRIQVGVLAGTPRDELIREVMGTRIEPIGPFRTAAARADAIVTTESNRVFNVATFQRYTDASTRIPDLQKEWITAVDGRVRPTHWALNGTIIPVNEPFIVGGFPAMHPLDESLPAAEAVRCRCRCVAVVPDEPLTAAELAEIGLTPEQVAEMADRDADEALEQVRAIGEEYDAELNRVQRQLDRFGEQVDRLVTAGNMAEAEQYITQIEATIQELAAVGQARKEKLASVLSVQNPARVGVEFAVPVSDAQRAAITEGAQEFARLCGAQTVDGLKVRVRVDPTIRRPYYLEATKTAVVGSAVGRRDVLHEIGHWFEHHDDDALKRTAAYLDKRTAGAVPRKLSEVRSFYDDDEMYQPGGFITEFWGKEYRRPDGTRSGTELTSMGLEAFAYDPVGLARKDPETFRFIYKHLRGM